MGSKGGGKSSGSSEVFFCFIGVYGPNLNKRHRKMWEELIGLIGWWDSS